MRKQTRTHRLMLSLETPAALTVRIRIGGWTVMSVGVTFTPRPERNEQ